MSYDHDFEPGIYRFCRRCGEEWHGPAGSASGPTAPISPAPPVPAPDHIAARIAQHEAREKAAEEAERLAYERKTTKKQPLTEHEWMWRGHLYRTRGSNLEVRVEGSEWIRSANIHAAVYAIRELAIKLAEKEEER